SSGDFTLSLNPTNLTLVRGTTGISNLNLTAVSGFRGTITLTATVSANATGIKASLSNSTVIFTSSGPASRLILLIVSTVVTNNPAVFYTVNVTGISGSLSHSAILTLILPLLEVPPVASFIFAPATPTTGMTINFTSTSFDPDAFIVRYNWTFSDFTTIITLNNTSVHHAFAKAGSYYVLLTVTDNANLKGFTSTTIIVGPAADEPPIPSFTFTPVNATVGQI